MIESFSDFHKTNKLFSLQLYGDGIRKEKLRNLIKHLRLSKKIKLNKFKSNIYPYIRHSSGLLMSSNWEGMSNIAQEALILNKKVLLTACESGPKELKNFGYRFFLASVNNNKNYIKNLILLTKHKNINNEPINKKYFKLYEISLKKLLWRMEKI